MTDPLTCAAVLDLIEAIAAGELAVDGGTRAHLESCPGCASALASAHRIEAALREREAPPAPPRFTDNVLSRIRRDRWLAEQKVDRLFNAAIAAGLLLMIGGTLALFNLNALLGAGAAAWGTIAAVSTGAGEGGAPTLGTYLASAGLLVSALATWWWAERRVSW